jgi:phosphonate transport system substrate-binding protein
MPWQFTVSPDFPPDQLPGWYVFNTWLQRTLGEPVHLETYLDFPTQRAAIAADQIDLIYANPYDAAMLVRDKGFTGVARPDGKSDEVVIAVAANNPATRVEDLRPGLRVASTQDPDINMMGMILLEPADLSDANVVHQPCVSGYALVARDLAKGVADVGFILADAYDRFSAPLRASLKVLARSQIHDVRHVFLVSPRLAERRETLLNAMLALSNDAIGRDILNGLHIPAWEAVEQEDMEFMIDLIDTLAEA